MPRMSFKKVDVRKRLIGHKQESTVVSDGNRVVTMVTELREVGGGFIADRTTFRLEFRAEDRQPETYECLDHALDAMYEA